MIISDRKKDDIIIEFGETIGRLTIARLENMNSISELPIRDIRELARFMAGWGIITAELKRTGINLEEIKLIGRSAKTHEKRIEDE